MHNYPPKCTHCPHLHTSIQVQCRTDEKSSSVFKGGQYVYYRFKRQFFVDVIVTMTNTMMLVEYATSKIRLVHVIVGGVLFHKMVISGAGGQWVEVYQGGKSPTHFLKWLVRTPPLLPCRKSVHRSTLPALAVSVRHCQIHSTCLLRDGPNQWTSVPRFHCSLVPRHVCPRQTWACRRIQPPFSLSVAHEYFQTSIVGFTGVRSKRGNKSSHGFQLESLLQHWN